MTRKTPLPQGLFARPETRKLVHGLVVSGCLFAGLMLAPGKALASPGCDAANSGAFDVSADLLQVISFSGDFEAGDVLHFATDANNQLVSLVNADSGLDVIAGTGALSDDFAITATQTYSFLGTLTPVLGETTTLTVTCTEATADGDGDGDGDDDADDDSKSLAERVADLEAALDKGIDDPKTSNTDTTTAPDPDEGADADDPDDTNDGGDDAFVPLSERR